MGPLPACRYDDIATAPRAYEDWPITLVDTILRVPSTYAPPDLVSTKQAGLAGGGLVRKVALADLKSMAAAARKAGAPIAVQSAYRSYAQQKATFNSWVASLGYAGALKVSARPGHSEHQLGLAIDFRSDPGGPPWSGADWAKSPAGSWMLGHAWRYGWVLSYPRGSFDTVCYSYEPWHYRYVGRSLAARLRASGLTLRAFLWANFTTTVVPAAPQPSATPGASAVPSASPFGSAGASAAPTSTPAATIEPAATAASAPPASPPPSPTGFPEGAAAGALAVGGVGLVILVAIGLLVSRRGRQKKLDRP